MVIQWKIPLCVLVRLPPYTITYTKPVPNGDDFAKVHLLRA